MKEAIKSKFQFSNPRIVEVSFRESQVFDKSKYQSFGLNYETEISNKKENTADLSLTIQVGLDEETVPFMLNAKVEASFRWEDGAFEEDAVNKLLEYNAKVLLLSYLRPFISHLIVEAGYPPFVLPFYDFSEPK